MNATKMAQDELLVELRDAILSATEARAVYLFGSRARGDHRPDSDMDILVVLWNNVDQHEIAKRVKAALPPSPFPIDFKTVTAERFEWRKRFANTIEQAADREGVVLHMTTEFDDRFNAAHEWFERAEKDLEMARLALGYAGQAPNICFHVQQYFEKCLKGFLTLHDVEAERTHDLGNLTDECAAIDESFSEWRDRLTPMSEWATTTRYPSKQSPTDEDGRRAVETAERFHAFITDKIDRLRGENA